jgi:transcriptional regulator with XRE-family HTH domain
MKERREELGITQTQLAEMIGVTKGAVGNYETDANSPKASIMYKVFTALQCDANYLYQDEMKEPESKMLPVEERSLLKLFRQLNDEGQEKLTDYADDLVQSGKYIKSSEIQLGEKEA